MSTATLHSHIESTPGVLGGKPRIQGRRISVQDIVVWHERQGQSAEEIALGYDLSLAEIYAALAYYYDHKETVDAAIEKDRAFVEEMKIKVPSKLAKKQNVRKA